MRNLMNRFFFACIFTFAGILLTGCDGGGIVADQSPAQAETLEAKSAEVDYLQGVQLQRQQQPQQACDSYASAVAKCPEELSYLLAEAEMLVALNKPADAMTLLQSKASYFNHSGVIRDEIGQLLIQQKRYAEAVPVLREASILAGDDSTIREHLAFALLSDKQFSDAADLFARLAREPGYNKRADVQAAEGECQSETNRLQEAIASYQLATQLEPDCAGYWIGLAKVLAQSNDLANAESAIGRAITLDSSSGDAQCLMGYIRLKENQLPESLTAFHTAAGLNPTDSVSECMQGYVLSRMRRMSESQQFYERALSINPHDELAARLMAGGDSHD